MCKVDQTCEGWLILLVGVSLHDEVMRMLTLAKVFCLNDNV